MDGIDGPTPNDLLTDGKENPLWGNRLFFTSSWPHPGDILVPHSLRHAVAGLSVAMVGAGPDRHPWRGPRRGP